jgi:CRISPR-associated protein Cas1
MTAIGTLQQLPPPTNSGRAVETPRPRHGVITLRGYGSSVRVDRVHLVVCESVAGVPYEARLPRVGHGLRRLVVIGSDGFMSLAALRWLADQKAAFVMLDRDGSILVATGPVGPSDARLRRAQALVHHTGVAVPIMHYLIDRKLAGQEHVARERLQQTSIADTIASAREALHKVASPDTVRLIESQAAVAYWSAWHKLPVIFPTKDLRRVPEHWRAFGARRSPVSGSSRVACNPANAVLNYLYAVLESEARLALVAVGLDPGMGILHVDTNARDSFALDVMEAVRPNVDAYLLDWMMRHPFRREWFFEQRDGSCRLMGAFARRLSETAPTWADAVAPVVERVAEMLWSTVRKAERRIDRATPLTQRHRREAKGASEPSMKHPERPPHACRRCGATIRPGQMHCKRCDAGSRDERMRRVAAAGRLTANSPKANAQRSQTRCRQAAAARAWNASEQPAWLTEQVYREEIQPRLANVSASRLAAALSVSTPYAVHIRAGRRRPHPRHWAILALLVRVSNPSERILCGRVIDEQCGARVIHKQTQRRNQPLTRGISHSG